MCYFYPDEIITIGSVCLKPNTFVDTVIDKYRHELISLSEILSDFCDSEPFIFTITLISKQIAYW